MSNRDLSPEDRHRCQVIHGFREAYGIPVTHMARKADISARWLIWIEKQERAPSLRTCKKLADALGIPLGYITSDAFRPEVMAALEAAEAIRTASKIPA